MPRVSISEAVVVDGGLTPPPSTFYPGRKCYMVTVTFGKVEHFGFGPSPSIARAAAIRSTLEQSSTSHSSSPPPTDHPQPPMDQSSSPATPFPTHPPLYSPDWHHMPRMPHPPLLTPFHPYPPPFPSSQPLGGFVPPVPLPLAPLPPPILHPPTPQLPPLPQHPLFLYPPPPLDPEDSSSEDEDDESSQQISRGLHEVIPSPESAFSPFNENTSLSDPFQFTVRLPKRTCSSSPCKPPWKDVLTDANSPLAKTQEPAKTQAPAKMQGPVRMQGPGTQAREPPSKREPKKNVLPTHFLLKGFVEPSGEEQHYERGRYNGWYDGQYRDGRYHDGGPRLVPGDNEIVTLPTEGLLQ